MHRLERAHTGLKGAGRMEDVAGLREGKAGICHHQQRHGVRQCRQFFAGDHQLGAGDGKCVGIFGIAEQRHVAGFRVFQRRDIAERHAGGRVSLA